MNGVAALDRCSLRRHECGGRRRQSVPPSFRRPANPQARRQRRVTAVPKHITHRPPWRVLCATASLTTRSSRVHIRKRACLTVCARARKRTDSHHARRGEFASTHLIIQLYGRVVRSQQVPPNVREDDSACAHAYHQACHAGVDRLSTHAVENVHAQNCHNDRYSEQYDASLRGVCVEVPGRFMIMTTTMSAAEDHWCHNERTSQAGKPGLTGAGSRLLSTSPIRKVKLSSHVGTTAQLLAALSLPLPATR
jgi:hypothetical protein